MNLNISLCGTNEDISQITKLFLERPCENPKVLLINNQRVKIEIYESVNEPPSTDKIDAYIFAFYISDLQSITKITKLIKAIQNKNDNKNLNMIFVAYPLDDRYEIEDEKLIPESKYEELENEYHCPVIEVSLRSGENVEIPFHKLIQNVVGFYDVYDSHDKEYDLFKFIKSDFTIGLFGCGFKTNLLFMLIYGIYYESKYNEYRKKQKFDKLKESLSKIVDYNDQFVSIYFIDSTLDLTFEEKIFLKLKGSIFVFTADIDKSLDELDYAYNKAKNQLGDKIVGVIAAHHDEPNKRVYPIEMYKEIEAKYNLKVFEFSLKTGENVDEMLFYLLKIIFNNE